MAASLVYVAPAVGFTPRAGTLTVLQAVLVDVTRSPIGVPNTNASPGRSLPVGSVFRISNVASKRVEIGTSRAVRVLLFPARIRISLRFGFTSFH